MIRKQKSKRERKEEEAENKTNTVSEQSFHHVFQSSVSPASDEIFDSIFYFIDIVD